MSTLLKLWDYFIYRRAYFTFSRMIQRGWGHPIVMQLWLEQRLANAAIPPSQRSLAEAYFEQENTENGELP